MTRASSGRPAASGGADGSRRRAARDGLVGAAALALVGLGTALWRLADRPPAQSEVDLRDLDPDPGDASPALDEALARISRAGGGVLHLPPGRWRLSEPLRASVPGLVVRGAGLRATRLVVPEGAAHAAVQVSADGVVLERFTVEGNLASWSGGDGPGLPVGIRVGDSAADVSLRDLVVEQATGYGIGLQRDGDLSGGVFDALVLRDVTVAVSGSDGIDIKNYDVARPACPPEGWEDEPATPDGCNGRRSFVRNLSVRRPGALFPVEGRKSGIDVRGQRQLQSVEVLDVTPGNIGVSLRPGAGGRPNGRGAAWSVLTGCFTAVAAPTDDEPGGAGIVGADVRGVVVDAATGV